MNVLLENLMRHLRAVTIPRNAFENPQGLAEVQSYIENEFRSYGLTVERQAFQYQGKEFTNLIASKCVIPAEAGIQVVGKLHPKSIDSVDPRLSACGDDVKDYRSNLSNKLLIIASHFDAVAGTPGADDNASGVAAMLEAARILSQAKIARPVKFIAFNVEEYGMVGSRAYVQSLKSNRGQTPIGFCGMISLEMVGYTAKGKGSQKMPAVLKPFYPDAGNFLALVGDFHSAKFLKEAERAFKEVKDLPVRTLKVPMKGWAFRDTRLSDHSPFWDAGIPALLVTDTSFFRNPHYHKPTDTIETLDLDFLARVTEGAIRLSSNEFKGSYFLARLANQFS